MAKDTFLLYKSCIVLFFIFFITILPLTKNQTSLVCFGNKQFSRMNIIVVSYKFLFRICQDGSIGNALDFGSGIQLFVSSTKLLIQKYRLKI